MATLPSSENIKPLTYIGAELADINRTSVFAKISCLSTRHLCPYSYLNWLVLENCTFFYVATFCRDLFIILN